MKCKYIGNFVLSSVRYVFFSFMEVKGKSYLSFRVKLVFD